MIIPNTKPDFGMGVGINTCRSITLDSINLIFILIKPHIISGGGSLNDIILYWFPLLWNYPSVSNLIVYVHCKLAILNVINSFIFRSWHSNWLIISDFITSEQTDPFWIRTASISKPNCNNGWGSSGRGISRTNFYCFQIATW